jgi:hypothetical protein
MSFDQKIVIGDRFTAIMNLTLGGPRGNHQGAGRVYPACGSARVFYFTVE